MFIKDSVLYLKVYVKKVWVNTLTPLFAQKANMMEDKRGTRYCVHSCRNSRSRKNQEQKSPSYPDRHFLYIIFPLRVSTLQWRKQRFDQSLWGLRQIRPLHPRSGVLVSCVTYVIDVLLFMSMLQWVLGRLLTSHMEHFQKENFLVEVIQRILTWCYCPGNARSHKPILFTRMFHRPGR